MRAVRAISTLVLALAVLALAPTPGRADGDRLAGEVLAFARARYASMRTLEARFEGSVAIYDARTTISGSIAYRAPDAARQEMKFASGRTLVTLQTNERLRRWEVRGEEVRDVLDRRQEGAVPVPILPAFDGYDESSLRMHEMIRVEGRPTVYVVEARYRKPSDPGAAARLGIEDGSWLVRTLDILDARGDPAMSIRFADVKVDAPLPEGVFAPVAGN